MHLNDPMLVGEQGKHLYRQCAPTIKKLGLELGGNAPFIVDDADLDAVVEGAPIFPEVGAADKTVAFNEPSCPRQVNLGKKSRIRQGSLRKGGKPSGQRWWEGAAGQMQRRRST